MNFISAKFRFLLSPHLKLPTGIRFTAPQGIIYVQGFFCQLLVSIFTALNVFLIFSPKLFYFVVLFFFIFKDLQSWYSTCEPKWSNYSLPWTIYWRIDHHEWTFSQITHHCYECNKSKHWVCCVSVQWIGSKNLLPVYLYYSKTNHKLEYKIWIPPKIQAVNKINCVLNVSRRAFLMEFLLLRILVPLDLMYLYLLFFNLFF